MIREFIMIIVILIVLVGYIYQIQIPLTPRYDPPSIYNFGGGGYSQFYMILAESGYKVLSIRDFDQLDSIEPLKTVVIIASPDKPLDPGYVEKIISWISRGGLVLALDEIGTLDSIARLAGYSIGYMNPSITIGECYIGNTSFNIYLNRYSPIRRLENTTPRTGGECYAEGYLVGVLVRLGRGEIFLLGDSSLFINAMLRYNKTLYNMILFKYLVRDRDVIVFYEGDRQYVYFDTSSIISFIQATLNLFSYILSSIVNKDPVLGLVLFLFFSLLSLYLYLRKYLNIPSVSSARVAIDRESIYTIDRNYIVKRYSEWMRES